VAAVKALKDKGTAPLSQTLVAKHLGISKQAVSASIKIALDQGWLVNKETKKGHPYDLDLGEPLPEPYDLPKPEILKEDFDYHKTSLSDETQAFTNEVSDIVELSEMSQPVGSLTGEDLVDDSFLIIGEEPSAITEDPFSDGSPLVRCNDCSKFDLQGSKGICKDPECSILDPFEGTPYLLEGETSRSCSYFTAKVETMSSLAGEHVQQVRYPENNGAK
jgi:biotin operon repressor